MPDNNQGLRFGRVAARTSRMGGFLLTAALTISGTAVWADDDGKGYGHDPKSHVEKLTEKLSLTQEQKENILPIIEEKHQKMEALHDQMKDIRQQAMDKIQAILTPEQQEKWEEMQEKRREKMKEYREKHQKEHKKGMHSKSEHQD